MRHHSEIIAVALEDLVMHVKSRLAGCAVFSDFCHINALIKERQYCLNWQKKVYLSYVIGVTLRTFLVILVYATANLKATFQHLLA